MPFCPFLSFLIALILVTHAFASVTIPIESRINWEAMRSLVAHDRARHYALTHRVAKDPQAHLEGRQGPYIENIAVLYVAYIGIGYPASYYWLIIDTGSSNTWVGANNKYVETSSSIRTDQNVSVTYGSGYFSGTEWLDRVLPGTGLVINNQSIGVADVSYGFSGEDGILGIGPTVLTLGTLSPATYTTIPTVTDNLYNQHQISRDAVCIAFKPFDSGLNSVMTWGEPDQTQYVGSLNYIPRSSTFPASYYWGIDAGFTYGNTTTLLQSGAGIVDTGTTLLYLTTDAYNRYQAATGSTYDSTTGLLYITPDQYIQLQNFYVNANGHSFVLIPDAQIWPRFLNTNIGGSSDYFYLTIVEMSSGSGLDFILGYTFLERYYSVYDSTNGGVGLAANEATYGTYNSRRSDKASRRRRSPLPAQFMYPRGRI